MSASGDCVFCKVVSGGIPAPRLFEDADFICIRDIQPKARIHLLLIPKRHIASLETAFPEGAVGEQDLLGRMFFVAAQVAREQKLLPLGFRAVFNVNSGGGQTVFHLHLHLLGGETFSDGSLQVS